MFACAILYSVYKVDFWVASETLNGLFSSYTLSLLGNKLHCKSAAGLRFFLLQ